MRFVVYISGLFVLLFLLVSCLNTRTNASIENNKFGKVTESRLVGTYRGDLPCTDCEAIATVLTIKSDKDYTLEYVYVGKSAEAFSKSGKWDLQENELNLEGLDFKYKVEPNQLRQLDLSGNEITGDLAERYVLHSLD
ncbi:copper resistance protein NlpE [Sphingobacterium oryzagri]|uniref:Copper resistance protein NlpE n=1 Tax=Sphingobacterium oryzagri TaxID=3025669 RepID=A0ABY7WHL3_9SPHI|nr:copper resistance protein NlpE [Sphingobacterium sp. KACC 22765]WDF67873.1 copper resistance protein NlpE [Sphingobacterium sp. KACC 22765]